MDESRDLFEALRKLTSEVEKLRERVDQLEGQGEPRPAGAAPPPPTGVEAATVEAERKVRSFLDKRQSPAELVAEDTPEKPAPPHPPMETTSVDAQAPAIGAPEMPALAESVPVLETVQPIGAETSTAAQQEDEVDRQLREQLAAAPASPPPPVPEKAALVGFEKELSGPQQTEGLESRIASYWFLRIAVAAIAVGFVYYARRRMVGPIPKIFAGYAGSIALMVLGLWRERRFPIWAHPLIAAGLALSYFTTYAMGFVGPMKVIDSLPLILTLLSANVLLIGVVAEWRRSESIAGVSLIVGYITTIRSQTEQYAVLGIGVLSIAAIVFMWRNRWFYASLGAVIATYAAHLYTWKYVPQTTFPSPEQTLRYHALILSCYFGVFAIGSLLSRRHARTATDTDDKGLLQRTGHTDRQLLSLFTRLNVAFFFAGMIYLLRDTQLYWDRAYVFFFAFAAATLALSTGFRELPEIRFTYQFAGSLSLTFGLISYFSPAWMPLMVAIQGLALLYLAAREKSGAWFVVSLLALAYSAFAISRFFPAGLASGGLAHQQVQWWTAASCTVIYLTYAELLHRKRHDVIGDSELPAAVLCGLAAAMYLDASFRLIGDTSMKYWALLMAPIGVAALAVAVRRSVLLSFVLVHLALFLCYLLMRLILSGPGGLPLAPFAVFAGAALVTGYAIERIGSGSAGRDGRASVIQYLAMFAAMVVVIQLQLTPAFQLPALASTALAGIAIGYAASSSRLVFTSLFPVVATGFLFALRQGNMLTDAGIRQMTLLSLVLLLVASVIFGSERIWQKSDGSVATRRFGEGIIAVLAAIMFSFWAMAVLPVYGFVLIALLGLVLCAEAALLRRPVPVVVALLVLLFTGVVFAHEVSRFARLRTDSMLSYSGLATVVILVAVERLLVLAARGGPGSDRPRLVNAETVAVLSMGISGGALAMLIVSLYMHPQIESLLFTVALGMTGFLWTALGFAFGSTIYRRPGFTIICAAILKAFFYDVWQLPETYIAVSLISLGVLLLPVSYFYTRNREKINRWL